VCRASSGLTVAGEDAVNPRLDLLSSFDKLLSKTSVKPDSNYGDGFCQCTTNSDCNTGEICSLLKAMCVKADTGKRVACYTYLPTTCKLDRDDDPVTPSLKIEEACLQQTHVAVDQNKALDQNNLGPDMSTWYSPTSDNVLDEAVPSASFSTTIVNHGEFLQNGTYGPFYGSGIKDLFQNCYTPNGAPGCVRKLDTDPKSPPGTFLAPTTWISPDLYPTCDLTGSTLGTHGLFNASYFDTAASQNKLQTMSAFAWDKSAVDFYKYKNSRSYVTDWSGFENAAQDGAVSAFLYYDSTPGVNKFYLIVVVGKAGGAKGGSYKVAITTNEGTLSSAMIQVKDDSPDGYVLSGDTLTANWSWAAPNTDGLVLELPGNGNFTIAPDPTVTIPFRWVYPGGVVTLAPGEHISITPAEELATFLKAQYSFDETSGAVAVNTMNASYAATVSTGISFVPGKLHSAVRMSAAGQEVTIPQATFQPTNAMTVSFWLNVDAYKTGEYQRIVGTGPTADPGWLADTFAFHLERTTNDLVWRVTDGTRAAWVSAINRQTSAPVGSWHFYTGVADIAAGSMKLYMDGALVGQTALTGFGMQFRAISAPITVSSLDASNSFKGAVDELKLYTRALSDNEVLAEYTNNIK